MRANSTALCFATLASLVALSTPARGLELTDKVDAQFQLRSRFVYLEGKDNNLDNDPLEYFENRARVALDARPLEQVRAFFQIQDVRVWGEEANTLGDYSANGLDIHQAYADLEPTKQLTLRVGRQEINYEGQRLIGAVGWTPQARSFDAARAMFAWEDKLFLDAFFAMVMDTESVIPGPPTNTNLDRQEAGAVHGRYRLTKGEDSFADVSLTGVFDFSRAINRGRWTIGVRHNAKFGLFRYRVEGYYQGGKAGGQDISAFLVGARAGVALKDPGLTVDLWADLLSGTSDPAKAAVETFDTLYATNHKFYGFSDFFLNIPAHTQGKGLVDLALKAGYVVAKPVKLTLHLHKLFATNPQGGAGDWGFEIDFGVKWTPYKGVALTFDVFTLLPGTAMTARTGGEDPDISFYGGVQTTF